MYEVSKVRMIENKLNQFYQDIMQDVNKERKKILDECDSEITDTINKKELEYLEQAYNTIQKELKEIKKEKNEIILKASMDSKKKLLNKREEIIEEVIRKTIKMLNNFIESKDYRSWLLDKIEKENISDTDEIIIYLLDSDKVIEKLIKEKWRVDIKSDSNIIGGYILHNITQKIYIDNSLRSKIENIRENILNICQIEIE